MRRGSRRRAIAVAVAVVGIDVALLWPAAASASAPVAVGGWRIERQGTPAGAVPTSQLTDDGTLAVRNSPVGVAAFAALRYDASGGTLALELAGQPPPTVPVIDACRVTSSWTAGADQTWDSKPSYDCGHHVAGEVSGSQISWEIDSGFHNGGALDIALVPDPTDTTPYAVSFTLPTSAAFVPSNDAAFAAPPPPVAAPADASAAAAPPATGAVPNAGTGVAPAAAPPVVAPATPSSAPQFAATPTAATREPASRTAGAGALAAFALILLVRSFVTGRPRGRTPRSLLVLNREGA